MSTSPNKEINTSESSDPMTPGVGATEMKLHGAAWCKKVEDDNAFLRNQVTSIQNSMELLLTRLPQPTTEQLFMPRREGPWIVDGHTTWYLPHRIYKTLSSSSRQA